MKIQLALAIALSIAIKVNQLRHFPLKAGAAQINFLLKNSLLDKHFRFKMQSRKKIHFIRSFLCGYLRCISCNLYILQRFH